MEATDSAGPEAADPETGRSEPSAPVFVHGVRLRGAGRVLIATVAAIEVVTATAALAADVGSRSGARSTVPVAPRPAAPAVSAGGSLSSGRSANWPAVAVRAGRAVAARDAISPPTRARATSRLVAAGIPPASPAAPRPGSRTSTAGQPPAGRPPAPPVNAAATTSPPTSGPPPAPVSCQTDLSLAAAPDTGYDFLCSQGGTPLTWAGNRISVYESGLTPLQSTAFAVAVAQWSVAARFGVTYASSAADAEVTVSDASLTSGASGFVEDGYTTVSYRCAPRCVYYAARMELSPTVALTQTDWVSTILHELGHVAGLNHVSETAEVMYPYLTMAAPTTYRAGDLAGLAVLAAERGA